MSANCLNQGQIYKIYSCKISTTAALTVTVWLGRLFLEQGKPKEALDGTCRTGMNFFHVLSPLKVLPNMKF